MHGSYGPPYASNPTNKFATVGVKMNGHLLRAKFNSGAMLFHYRLKILGTDLSAKLYRAN